MLERKNAFLGYKNKKFKKSWFSMVFGQNWLFFYVFFKGNIGEENVFYDMLQRKNGFLGFKNKKLKKSKN